jgi:acyl-CoA thioester hydrolase
MDAALVARVLWRDDWNTMAAPSVSDSPTQCNAEIRVRYAECDAMGYLHHAKYWEYFEVARTDLLRQLGFRYRDMESEGILFVVYKAACRYILPIRYDDLVIVTVAVERTSSTRVDHSYWICRGESELTTEATSTLACVGLDGRPRRMPAALWSGA